mgnify:CR=1 FL=1|jgi:glycosyltransferase involved in cell wall biosynthesis
MIMLKLSYITRTNISSQAAQAKQIKSMSMAFYNELKDNFELVCPGDKDTVVDFSWNRVSPAHNKWTIYLIIIWKAIKRTVIESQVIFTRDILISMVVVLFGGRSIYEAHKEPKGKIAFFFFVLLCKSKNFKIVAISQALSNYYIYSFNINKKYILTAHDGVFLNKYDKLRKIPKKQFRKELNLPIDKTIVVHTGSLYKGNDAKLFKGIVSNFKDMLFVQVGGSSVDINRYKKYYRGFDNILFIPHQGNDTVLEYQMSADLLFYALTKENDLWWCTSPLKVFEYMATGIPMLASNIGSVSEVLNNKNSIPFCPKTKESVVNGVNYFLNNKESVNTIAKQALKDVSNKYTWNIRVKSVCNFINRI